MTDTNQAETLLAQAIDLRTAGRYAEATRVVADATALWGNAMPGPAHHEAGLTCALAGQLQEAIQHFRRALDLAPSDLLRYALASCLACAGQLEEAQRLFARGLLIGLTDDEQTSTHAIQLLPHPEPESFDDAAPFARHMERPVQAAPDDCRLVLLVACDVRYLRLFAAPLAMSLAEHTTRPVCLHIHVVNPSPADEAWLAELADCLSFPLRWSSERVVFPSLDQRGRYTWYSCARFLVAPDVAAANACPLLVTDIDQLVVGDLDALLEATLNAPAAPDLCLLRYPHNQHNLLSLFSASVLLANSTAKAHAWLVALRRHLLRQLSDPRNLTWHLDQAALATTYLNAQGVTISDLPDGIMHSSLDGSTTCPDDALFWSVTYHVAGNAAKLDDPRFSASHAGQALPAPPQDNQRFLSEDPRVTIVIPVYNGANYLAEAIDSALAQTWDNLEVLVVNDGSTDAGATEAIALGYGERIRYIRQDNGGVASALNTGIRNMTGDVFCWLSHDDLHTAEKTAAQVAQWRAIGCTTTVLYSDYTLINASGEVITPVQLDHALLSAKPVYALYRAAIHGCSVFVPKAAFAGIDLFDTNLPTTQDYDLWARMVQRVPFRHMARSLVLSRWHDEQGSKQADHQVEANAFWSKAIGMLPEQEHRLLEGSTWAFMDGMATFLEANGLTGAAAQARTLAADAIADTLVGVVLLCRGSAKGAAASLASVLAQTHAHLDIVLVHTGPAVQADWLAILAQRHAPRVRLLRMPGASPAAACTAGAGAADGRYVAFLDNNDLLLPTKIATQLRAMVAGGQLCSHTAYWQQSAGGEAPIRSRGVAQECACPELLAHGPPARGTVMVDRNLIPDSHSFAEDSAGGDLVTWLRIAVDHQVLGIDEPLSVLRNHEDSCPGDTRSQRQVLRQALAAVLMDPVLRRQTGAAAHIGATLRALPD